MDRLDDPADREGAYRFRSANLTRRTIASVRSNCAQGCFHVCDNWKYGSFKDTDVLGIRYRYPPVHTLNVTDPCVVGITLLTFGEYSSGIADARLKSLSKLHELGILPLVAEVRILQSSEALPWFMPWAFSRQGLRYFSAFTNVQKLRLERMVISSFMPEIERYFGQFSVTLQSITLIAPRCTLDNYPISSPISQTSTTSKFGDFPRLLSRPAQPPPTQSSFQSPRRNYEGSWCLDRFVMSRPGRISSLHVVVYGSVLWTCAKSQIVPRSFWRRARKPWRYCGSFQLTRVVSSSAWVYPQSRADGKYGVLPGHGSPNSIYHDSRSFDLSRLKLGQSFSDPRPTVRTWWMYFRPSRPLCFPRLSSSSGSGTYPI